MVHKLSNPASSARRASRRKSGAMCSASVPIGNPPSEIPSFMATMFGRRRRGSQGPDGPWDCQYHPELARWCETTGVQAGDGLGSYIQAWRHRLQPAEAGFPAGSPRRTRGLRREELALLAGISVDYLVRLEQGRATNPSTQVLAAVYDPAWTIITWNAAWAALMGDPSAVSGRDRNLLWRTFTGTSTRVRKNDDQADEFEVNAVSDLRRAVGAYPDDARLHRLVDELAQASPRFAQLWAERAVSTTGSTNSKTIEHPQVGPITLDCDVLTVAGSDLRLVVYTAEPASPDADRHRLTQIIGLQELTGPDR